MDINEVFEMKSLSDCMEEYRANQKKLDSKIYIEDDYIVLNIDYKYFIELDRCDTPNKLLHWIYHLLGKVWMTTELLENFIVKVAKYHNFDIYGL